MINKNFSFTYDRYNDIYYVKECESCGADQIPEKVMFDQKCDCGHRNNRWFCKTPILA